MSGPSTAYGRVADAETGNTADTELPTILRFPGSCCHQLSTPRASSSSDAGPFLVLTVQSCVQHMVVKAQPGPCQWLSHAIPRSCTALLLLNSCPSRQTARIRICTSTSIPEVRDTLRVDMLMTTSRNRPDVSSRRSTEQGACCLVVEAPAAATFEEITCAACATHPTLYRCR